MLDVLSKYIAHAGICSRRKAAELIKQGAVTVNGAVVYEPGYRVDNKMVVKVNKKMIRPEEKVYILLNKPRNCVTTVSDERERATVMDLLEGAPRVRLYPVGRLDRGTTGLLLLTNDGYLAQALSHPSNEVPKIYKVTLNKNVLPNDIKNIAHGIRLEEGIVKVDSISLDERESNVAILQLHSGQNRVVRRLFEHCGYDVKRLDRIGYAGLTKKNLLCGKWRYLTNREVTTLKKLLD